MAKSLFLFLISALMGITLVPDILTSADSVRLKEPDFAAVETVPLPEPVVEEQVVESVISEVFNSAPVVYATPAPRLINYTVTIYSGEIVAHNLSYYDIYKTGNLVYAHNSANLLGNLGTFGIGSDFTITEGEVTRLYSVANVVMFEKNDGKLQLGGQGSYMRGVLNANFSGVQYGVALMTCAGTSYGNGDASHRLVVFANPV